MAGSPSLDIKGFADIPHLECTLQVVSLHHKDALGAVTGAMLLHVYCNLSNAEASDVQDLQLFSVHSVTLGTAKPASDIKATWVSLQCIPCHQRHC